MSQGVTSLTKSGCHKPGRAALVPNCSEQGRSTQAQCSKWSVLEGLRPTSLECGSASLSASETHLSNHRKHSPWKSTDFHHEMEPSLKQPEISGKCLLHSKYSLCCSVTVESSFAVAGFEAQLTNCYWANQHHSLSIPGGTEALLRGAAPILHCSFPDCRKMANKHWTFLSHATFPSCKEWLQTSADSPFWSFLGGTILTFLL